MSPNPPGQEVVRNFLENEEKAEACSLELRMHKFLIGRIVVILIFAVVFYFGVAGLKTGEIRSRGYKLNRGENPVGYWFTIMISLLGPVAIIYLMLTR